MKKIIFIIIYLVASLCLYGQRGSTATLRGHILEIDTEEHLPSIVVKIEGTNLAEMTDDTGHFSISGIAAGTYFITAHCIGFKTAKQEVILKAGENKNISLYMHPDTQQLGEVAIVASARTLNRKMSPVVVNQLTVKTFEATNSATLSQGLNYVPGLRVETNCQNCGTQEVRINGLEGQYSQILINEQAIFTSLSKMYGLEQLPANMIENVEVIRGGGSVLYGASAIGGVVNITTKEPEKNSYQVKCNLSMIDGESADNNLSINTSFVDKAKTSGISLFTNMRNRNSWDANNDGFSEIGRNRATSAGLRAFLKPTLQDKLTVEYHHISEERRGGDNLKKPPHETMIAEATDYKIHSGGLGYIHFSKDNKQKLTVNTSIQKTDRNSYYGANQSLLGYGNTDEIAFTGSLRYEFNIDRLLFMPAKLTAGFTQEHVNTTDSIYGRDTKQIINLSSLYIQNEWRNDDLTFIVGVRGDKHNILKKMNVIPRASTRYRLLESMNLRAAYSSGYRAPEITAADLDVPIIGGSATITVLDKDLKREYSNSFNGGFDYTFTTPHFYSYLLVEAFYTKINRVFITEETGTDAWGNTIMTRKNGDGAYVYGLNIEATAQPIDWVELQAGFTWQRSRYTTPIQWSSEAYVPTVKKMLRSPDTYGFFSATATPKKSYAVSLSGVYTGSMLTPHFAGGEGVTRDKTVKTRSFVDTTCKVSYFFNINSSNKIELNAGVQNIFNQIQKDYDKGPERDSEYIYGPSLPRTYFVGIKINSL